MPPKAKFTREEIIQAALQIVRSQGFSALTARALGEQLGSSPRPIFTIFENMEEVQQAVIAAAKSVYKEYIDKGLSEAIPFERGWKAIHIFLLCRNQSYFNYCLCMNKLIFLIFKEFYQ